MIRLMKLYIPFTTEKSNFFKIICFLFFFSIFWSCNRENCPTSRDIGLTPSSDMVLQQDTASISLSLQYPTNCAKEPYRGYYTIIIENPDVIPGASVAFDNTTFTVDLWSNIGVTPSSGREEVLLYAAPKIVDGRPAIPLAGDYQVELRVTFDDPDQRITVIVNVRVLDDGFNIVFLEPNANQQFYEGIDSIPLKALVSEQTNGIAKVEYRLDSQVDWISQDYSDLPQQVNIETKLGVTEGGERKAIIRATNGKGDVVVEEVEFLIPVDPNQLNDYYWDGGGDNLNWSDPFNWEADRLPTAQEKAIIDLPQTERVLLAADQFDAQVFEVGALDIRADMVIQNSAVLQLAGSEHRSFVRGSLRFNRTMESGPSTFRFGTNSNNSTFEIRDTLYLNNANLGSWSSSDNNTVRLNFVIAEMVPSSSIGVNLFGPVIIDFDGLVNQLIHVRWNFYENGLTPGAPSIYNSSRWRMVNGSTFFRDSDGPATSLIYNSGQMNIVREINGASFGMGGNIDFDSPGSWTDYPSNSSGSIDPGVIILELDPANKCRIETLRTWAKVQVKSGDWTFNRRLEASELSIEQESFVRLSNVDFYLQGVVIPSPDAILQLGTGALRFLHSNGYVSMTENILIDSLVLESGRFDVGSVTDSITVTTKYLDWRGARDISLTNGLGAIAITDHFYSEPSRLRPGDGEHYWNTNITLLNDAKLNWESGIIYSPNRKYLDLRLDNTAIFEIPEGADREWGWNFLSGDHRSFLRIYNGGTIRKFGANTQVRIAGCLKNTPTANVFSIGTFDIVQLDAVCP